MDVLGLIRLVGQFAAHLGWQWWAASIAVGIICGIVCRTTRHHKRLLKADVVAAALLGCYLTVVTAFTVFARSHHDLEQPYNLYVFATIAARLAPGSGAKYEVILNAVMLVPLGLLLPIIMKCGTKRIAVVALCLVVAIECLQLAFSIGTFELADIVENICGALLGYGIYALACFAHSRIKTMRKPPAHMA